MGTALTTSLADQINAEHRAAIACYKRCDATDFEGLIHERNAGKMLIREKRNCKARKEKWVRWVETNCTFSRRSASWYMRVAGNWKRLTRNGKRASQMSSRDARKLLAAPGVKPPKPLDENVPPLQARLQECVEERKVTQLKVHAAVAAGPQAMRGLLKTCDPPKAKKPTADDLSPRWVTLETILGQILELAKSCESVATLHRERPDVPKAKSCRNLARQIDDTIGDIWSELENCVRG